jgi:hypothetical protein
MKMRRADNSGLTENRDTPKAGGTESPITVGRRAWFTLALLSSTLLTVFFSETMLLPAIPEIIQDFNITYGTAAWIFSAYLIVAAVMTPVAGRLSDLYGKKKVLLILLTIYIVGLVTGGLAENISVLLLTRIVQGVGLAAVPAAFSLLRDTFPPAKLAIAVGVFGSAYSAGSVVGLLVGASIIQNFGWHATFLAIIPFAALVTIMIAKFVKEDKKSHQMNAVEFPGLRPIALESRPIGMKYVGTCQNREAAGDQPVRQRPGALEIHSQRYRDDEVGNRSAEGIEKLTSGVQFSLELNDANIPEGLDQSGRAQQSKQGCEPRIFEEIREEG